MSKIYSPTLYGSNNVVDSSLPKELKVIEKKATKIKIKTSIHMLMKRFLKISYLRHSMNKKDSTS